MSIPVIGITPLWDEDRDSLWMLPGYMDGVKRAGGMPVMLPLSSDEVLIEQICRTVDGLLFTGGQDVFPGLYHEEASAYCGPVCKKRDNMEIALFSEAVIKKNKPALGICRGLQLFNAALGGTLYQDLPSQFKGRIPINHRQNPPADEPSHTVMINSGSPLHLWLNVESIEVNSSHHQGVRVLSPELESMAVAEDGLIEAVYMPGRKYVWAVQWHPELILYDENSHILFDAFVGACNG